MNRRNFCSHAVSAAAGTALGNTADNSGPGTARYPAAGALFRDVRRYRKIDAHEHVGLGGTVDDQLKMADRLGIEKMVISKPVTVESRTAVTPEEFRKGNDLVLEAMKQHPDRYLGLVHINPYFPKESLEEIRRCTDRGMAGLKVYYQVKINDPLFFPIIEKAIDLKMILLVHSHCGIGVGGRLTQYGNIQPNASVPEDFADAARRYPEAMFQYAHLGGGGDWEYALKTIRDFPNIYADTSGSNNEAGIVDYACRMLGEDRLFFGTDSSYYQGVGAILSSGLNDAQRKKIFFTNFNEILRKSGRHVS